MFERGKVRNRDHAAQLRDFSGLRFGNITPTDVDAIVEFGGRLFIFVELKYGDAELPRGQRLCLERISDAINAPPNRRSIVLVAKHNDATGDVDCAAAKVVEYRWNGVWRHEFRTSITVRMAIDSMLLRLGGVQHGTSA